MLAVLIVGLPGSGKTYLAKTEYEPKGYRLVDDPREISAIKIEIAIAKAHCYNGIVIADPNLTLPGNLDKAKEFLKSFGCSSISTIYFENDWRKADRNVIRRNQIECDRGILNVEFYSKLYKIPDGIQARKIFQPIDQN